MKDLPQAGSVDADSLIVPAEFIDNMRQHVAACTPEEACGLLAGCGRLVSRVIPIRNMLHSPVRFKMDTQEQLRAFLSLDADGLDLLAIFHSHPNGPGYPSPTDIAEAFYPETAMLIWYLQSGRWRYNGFKVENGVVTKILLKTNIIR